MDWVVVQVRLVQMASRGLATEAGVVAGLEVEVEDRGPSWVCRRLLVTRHAGFEQHTM